MLTTFKTLLTSKTQLNSDTYLYHFDLIEPKEIKFRAGQYLMIKIPTDNGWISRLYSIASSTAEKNSFELIIQIIPGGLASGYLSGLKVKDELIFQGPAGFF
ncbi:MAG: FAD-binding oxidoreductase, partial [Candidatus Roizmanbacteria bacterium]|nr:FAD-binding oxidoreductase [Candidatus Roizmanbacteria bacterium]